MLTPQDTSPRSVEFPRKEAVGSRRGRSSGRKPVIHKLRGVPVWVCEGGDSWVSEVCQKGGRSFYPKGFGKTPAEAYADWKKWRSYY